MVRTTKPESENDKLAAIIRRLAEKHGCEVYQSGWSRTTYDVNVRDPNSRDIRTLVRVESFASVSGEIQLLAPEGRAYAEALGAEMEKTFPDVKEAVIIEKT
jgi:hypothetical protein